jgi:hypothetical protein
MLEMSLADDDNDDDDDDDDDDEDKDDDDDDDDDETVDIDSWQLLISEIGWGHDVPLKECNLFNCLFIALTSPSKSAPKYRPSKKAATETIAPKTTEAVVTASDIGDK